MKGAIFGGTFDPIHNAHLGLAYQALDRFLFDEVIFIPAANPPHKTASTPYQHRYRMVELACQSEPRFHPSRIEAGRQRSYSILTIERLRQERPADQFYFLIGADAFRDIRTWHRWEDVIHAVEFIVVSRPGHDYQTPQGATVHRLESLALPVSSSEIRDELAQGVRPEDVPPAVLDYIRENGLYRRLAR